MMNDKNLLQFEWFDKYQNPSYHALDLRSKIKAFKTLQKNRLTPNEIESLKKVEKVLMNVAKKITNDQPGIIIKNRFYSCIECGEIIDTKYMDIKTHDNKGICDLCYDEFYAICDICHEIYHHEEMHKTVIYNDSENICLKCAKQQI